MEREKEIKSRTNQHLFFEIAFLTVLVGIINNRVYEAGTICFGKLFFCTHFHHVYGKAIKFLYFLVFAASPYLFIALFVSEFCECKNWIIDWGTCHEKPSYLSNDHTCGFYINFFHSFIRHLWKVSISFVLLGLENLGSISQNITRRIFSLLSGFDFFFATRAESTELTTHLSRRIFHSILEFFIFVLNILFISEGTRYF